MKKMLFALFAIVTASVTFAQSSPVDQFFHKYEGKEGFTTVNVTEKLFSLFASAITDDPEMQSVVDGLKHIQILVYENEEGDPKSGQFYQEASAAIPVTQYEELMTVNSGTDKVRLLGKTSSDKVIDELLMIVDADGEFVLISILGTIDLDKISRISDLQIEGIDELKKLDAPEQK